MEWLTYDDTAWWVLDVVTSFSGDLPIDEYIQWIREQYWGMTWNEYGYYDYTDTGVTEDDLIRRTFEFVNDVVHAVFNMLENMDVFHGTEVMVFIII